MSATHDAVSFDGRAMGSPLRLSVVGLYPARARRAWELVAGDIKATEQALSRWRAESDLSRLNATAGSGELAAVGGRLFTFLAAASRAQRLTAGRFDPRVIMRLEQLGEHAGVALPALADELSSDRPWLTGNGRRREVCLSAPLDSGGIGKGLALRWALRAARRAGLLGSGLLLEAGGDMVVHGEPSEGGPWQVGVEDPAGRETPMAVISVLRGAVATSSTAVRRWTAGDGRTVHHLLDPATGEPGGEGLQAVTVSAPDPAWAEIWSKALFLAGSRGIGDAARRRDLAAWWVEDDGSLHMTPAARQQTAWTVSERAA